MCWVMSCSFSHTLLIYLKCKDTLYVCCLLFQWELFIPVIDDVTECNAPINTYIIVINTQVTSIEFLSFGQVLCKHFLQICIRLFFKSHFQTLTLRAAYFCCIKFERSCLYSISSAQVSCCFHFCLFDFGFLLVCCCSWSIIHV